MTYRFRMGLVLLLLSSPATAQQLPAPAAPVKPARGGAAAPQTVPPAQQGAAPAAQAPPAGATFQQTPPIAPPVTPTPLPAPVTVAPVAAPADVPTTPITADEAALIALRHQPQIAQALAAVEAAQGRAESTRSGLYPTLTLSGGYTDVETLSGPSTPTSSAVNGSGYSGSAGVRQLIFDFNHTLDLVRQAESLQTVATQGLNVVQTTLVLQVKQAYYAYVQAQQLAAVNQSNMTNRQGQLELAQARLASGLGLPSDVVTAEAALGAGANSLSVAENNASIARTNLELLMGIDTRIPVVTATTGEPAFPGDDVNAFVTQALQRRPEILEARANVRASRFGLSAARTNNAPAITGDLGLLSRGTSFPPGDDTFTVGAAISFSPFDGGLTAGLIKQARASVASSQAALTAAEQTVTGDVTQAYYNLRSAEQRVPIADSEVANATEEVTIAVGRYREGLGLFQDILTAQQALVSAETDQVNANAAVEEARAAMRRAVAAGLP